MRSVFRHRASRSWRGRSYGPGSCLSPSLRFTDRFLLAFFDLPGLRVSFLWRMKFLVGFPARYAGNDVYHYRVVVPAEAHVDAAAVELDRPVKQRRRDAGTIGKISNQLEIMRKANGIALHRNEASLRHPRCTNSELGRASASGGNRFDHEIGVDAGLHSERHRFGGSGDMDRNQKVVDQLDLTGGAERTEIVNDVAESPRDRFSRFRRIWVPSKINHGLARGHHAGSTANLAVKKDSTFASERRDLPLFIGDEMRAEFDYDLSRPSRVHETLFALHDLIERLGRRQTGQHEVSLRTDI